MEFHDDDYDDEVDSVFPGGAAGGEKGSRGATAAGGLPTGQPETAEPILPPPPRPSSSPPCSCPSPSPSNSAEKETVLEVPVAVEGALPPPPPAEQQHRRGGDKRQLFQAAGSREGGGGSGGRRSTGGRTYDGYASLPSGAGSVSRRDFGEEAGEDAYYLESECGGKRREGR